jgi:hypothetical protein
MLSAQCREEPIAQARQALDRLVGEDESEAASPMDPIRSSVWLNTAEQAIGELGRGDVDGSLSTDGPPPWLATGTFRVHG